MLLRISLADFLAVLAAPLRNPSIKVSTNLLLPPANSNDVANAIGPLAAVVSIVQSGGLIAGESATDVKILLLGASGIVFGLVIFGKRVITTVGKKITELTPSRGFAAELAAATTVVIASGTGLPISTTHTLVGAVLGVGLARGIAALNLGVIRTIVVSWVITLPAGATLSIIF